VTEVTLETLAVQVHLEGLEKLDQQDLLAQVVQEEKLVILEIEVLLDRRDQRVLKVNKDLLVKLDPKESEDLLVTKEQLVLLDHLVPLGPLDPLVKQDPLVPKERKDVRASLELLAHLVSQEIEETLA
jgi:hypothetical protein